MADTPDLAPRKLRSAVRDEVTASTPASSTRATRSATRGDNQTAVQTPSAPTPTARPVRSSTANDVWTPATTGSKKKGNKATAKTKATPDSVPSNRRPTRPSLTFTGEKTDTSTADDGDAASKGEKGDKTTPVRSSARVATIASPKDTVPGATDAVAAPVATSKKGKATTFGDSFTLTTASAAKGALADTDTPMSQFLRHIIRTPNTGSASKEGEGATPQSMSAPAINSRRLSTRIAALAANQSKSPGLDDASDTPAAARMATEGKKSRSTSRAAVPVHSKNNQLAADSNASTPAAANISTKKDKATPAATPSTTTAATESNSASSRGKPTINTATIAPKEQSNTPTTADAPTKKAKAPLTFPDVAATATPAAASSTATENKGTRSSNRVAALAASAATAESTTSATSTPTSAKPVGPKKKRTSNTPAPAAPPSSSQKKKQKSVPTPTSSQPAEGANNKTPRVPPTWPPSLFPHNDLHKWLLLSTAPHAAAVRETFGDAATWPVLPRDESFLDAFEKRHLVGAVKSVRAMCEGAVGRREGLLEDLGDEKAVALENEKEKGDDDEKNDDDDDGGGGVDGDADVTDPFADHDDGDVVAESGGERKGSKAWERGAVGALPASREELLWTYRKRTPVARMSVQQLRNEIMRKCALRERVWAANEELVERLEERKRAEGGAGGAQEGEAGRGEDVRSAEEMELDEELLALADGEENTGPGGGSADEGGDGGGAGEGGGADDDDEEGTDADDEDEGTDDEGDGTDDEKEAQADEDTEKSDEEKEKEKEKEKEDDEEADDEENKMDTT